MQNKSKNIFITSFMLIFLIIIIMIIRKYVFSQKSLISPISQKIENSQPTPVPTSAYDPPKVIKYDSSTDLKKELDSIDPIIQDNDFKELKDLTDSLKSS